MSQPDHSKNRIISPERTEIDSTNAEKEYLVGHLKEVLECNAIEALLLDQNLNIENFTATRSNRFGLKDEDLGNPFNEVLGRKLDNKESEQLRKEVHDSLEKGISSKGQVRDKSGRLYAKRVIPSIAPGGQKSKHVSLSFKLLDEISDREAELEQMTFELEKAQELATMGSWVLEIETGHVTWTPELHKMFGHDPSSPAPTLEEQKNWYTEKSWEAMIDAVNRTISAGSPYNIELETIRRDGTIGCVRSIGAAERDETGRIVLMRGVAQDISEIKEAEAKLIKSLQQSKTAQIYKDQFLANMSHEIRTPMNGVIGFAGLLRDEDLDPETKNEYLDTIESCSSQLLVLIDDIIENAKIEAGEVKIENQSFNLAELVRETAATQEKIRDRKEKSHIELKTYIPEGTENFHIHSDPFRIQQILNNLLSNAFKFSHEGMVEFGYKINSDAIVFFVKDSGIGIEPDRIDLVFERFEHHDGQQKKYEGTGLGLTISRGLAALLGGQLTLESEYNVGSIFRFELPAQIETESAEKDPENAETKSPTQHSSRTILVVEDEVTNQHLIRKVLEKAKLNYLFAQNGKEAVQMYQDHPETDLVLMDIRMPIQSGDLAAQEILKVNPDAKIIAQTAYAMPDEREKFMKAGFSDYIAKPFKPGELIEIIEKWLD